MTTVLCTLYNSLYLDKGLALYDSLCKCAKDFKLYVLCMDEKCYEILTDLHQDYHIPVKLSDFEAGDDDLLEAKSNRSIGEYCWTCSSSFIRYVLKHFREESCTYIDADMYFYLDPQVLVDEMLDAGKSVMVVPHRFPEENKELSKKFGTYCVEFNTFLNTAESLEVLEYWRGRCLDCCSNIGDGIHWGDQKYLDELAVKYNCLHVCSHLGAGVAPWNIEDYEKLDSNYNQLTYRPQRKKTDVVFYHFQSITYLSRKEVDTSVLNKNKVDRKLVFNLYNDYLTRIDKTKEFLSSRYNLDILVKVHPSFKSSFIVLLQKFSIIRKIWRKVTGSMVMHSIIIKMK